MTAVGSERAAGAATVPGQRRPPQERGRTEVSDRAVVKIAHCAAREVPEVTDVRLGGPPWSHSSGAQVHGDQATVKLNVSLVYPSPVHAVAARLREHVIRRVYYQTGLTVTRLDLAITDLDSGPRTGMAAALDGERDGDLP
ncbi:Asp23/Gls24 family envelope stress response protein [Nonomuraea zeae]|uniref:Asp23/Gls24 family envelope stress response protein n=1 Tax=Nonomuraea zeae TaxID=1642303 RepID=A0A5S4G8W7_9ACTN|nr:Asp23/Gls24 family envelope stress response protein [Nonomuraea zeae]TMR28891.1 Asp23/Gls24 family envelope stress response protein [Nonomuraea zeae]